MRRVQERVGIAAVVIISVLPWLLVVRTLADAKTPSVPTLQPNSIVWAGRVFTSPEELGRWLRSRGASYDTWLLAHPQSRAILDPTGVQQAGAATEGSAGGVAAPAGRSAEPAASARAPGGSTFSLVIEICGLLVTASLLALAAVPGRLLALIRPEWANVSVELRVAAFGVAVSVAAGVLVGRVVG